ncbi:TPA: hypothetical protein ACKP89_002570 [Stenotrophomonas maltophilia]|uniref:hypothetical protein n=1 Tax=Stenotrophomonas maltophilia TaxID=40324 RepID=UPI0015DEBA8C|nr:hypothetical protein [Stenotrophomonas maltophilia]MBN7829191.1 hypothetical protein [Stenotrophomonas maltophilia]MBN7832941.1 hypothetical protein [Stenotrophomonas maltophilia]MBN7857279.1 hypothetical protein [Stenotrophomonas maltophilia]MBN7918891.1 hypothetical protein [Stenotrophomonas maltophilia]MBO2844397.1 hypothetical protein [Stenotrophomonas maltophilia]
MNTPTESIVTKPQRHPWRPMFWEPVTGTGERILVGVLYCFEGTAGVSRFIRDESLDGMFGAQAAGARRLIDQALSTYVAIAEQRNGNIGSTEAKYMGLVPGPLRETSAHSLNDLLRTAALLYSSMASLAKLEDLDQAETPLPEDVNRRFSTEVKDLVLAQRPEFSEYFGRSTPLVNGGNPVKFGFASQRALLHFCVVHPLRVGASIRDARARLFELQRARELVEISEAALIGATTRNDDVTLGDKQRAAVASAREEIEAEALAARLRFYPVTSAVEGAERVLEAA